MRNSYTRLDQALKDLIEAYAELEEEGEEKYGDDEDSLAHAVVEALETSIESALEEHDISTGSFATILSNLTEALEQLDPSAFDDGESDDDEEYGLDDVEDIDDVDDDEDLELDDDDE